jgi:hypothetical protein
MEFLAQNTEVIILLVTNVIAYLAKSPIKPKESA